MFLGKSLCLCILAHNHLVFNVMDGAGPVVFFTDLIISLNYWWLFQFGRNVVNTAFVQGKLLNNADHVVDVVDP